MGGELLPECGDVPGPEQLALDQAVEPGGGRVVLRVRRAHHRVGGQVDPALLDAADVELVDARRVDDRGLDVEAVGGVAERLDALHRGEGHRAVAHQHRGTAVTGLARAVDAPVAHLGGERRVLVVEQPRGRRVVEVGQPVVAEAHALAELVLPGLVLAVHGVLDDARALPDTDEPRQRDEFGCQALGQFDQR
ncbi:hypothetical protein Cus16_2901 [Curtobacterium sp. ER1/6]|nr:hypothetical protein Cus16_2901 [Curtobacterium sp. ER1/6]